MSAEEQAIVTGFGPTNAPTAGTLSVLLKTLNLQRSIGCDAEIIVSDLGAFLSRNKSWHELQDLTDVFLSFIRDLAGDTPKVQIRSHIDKDNLSISSFVNEHILDTPAFLANKEATELLYDELGLLGSRLGVIADSTYTVSDIIKPFFKGSIVASSIHSRRRVLVIAGVEEHYFPRLARIALTRLTDEFGDAYTPSVDINVSALYTRLIPGFAPYPKMSKSIPASGLFLDDDESTIFRKILETGTDVDRCVIEMICQASNWSAEEISAAKHAFNFATTDTETWRKTKLRYAETFCGFAASWSKAKGTSRALAS